jgi:hypothetical protein
MAKYINNIEAKLGVEGSTVVTTVDYQLSNLKNGWVYANDTWTYATSGIINVASGAATRHQKGDLIMFTQHGVVKYMYVVGIADTQLSVFAGTDYVVENTATYPITLPYYSHELHPVGFPHQFNATAVTYAAAYLDNGSGVAVTSASHIFYIVGNTVHEIITLGTCYKVGTNTTIFTGRGAGFPVDNGGDYVGLVHFGTANLFGWVRRDSSSTPYLLSYGNITDNADLTGTVYEYSYQF